MPPQQMGRYEELPLSSGARTPGDFSGVGRGRGFGALLAGGLGGMGQGMMSPEFRRAYQLGAGGVEEAQGGLDLQTKLRQQYQRDRDEWTERRRLRQRPVSGSAPVRAQPPEERLTIG